MSFANVSPQLCWATGVVQWTDRDCGRCCSRPNSSANRRPLVSKVSILAARSPFLTPSCAMQSNYPSAVCIVSCRNFTPADANTMRQCSSSPRAENQRWEWNLHYIHFLCHNEISPPQYGTGVGLLLRGWALVGSPLSKSNIYSLVYSQLFSIFCVLSFSALCVSTLCLLSSTLLHLLRALFLCPQLRIRWNSTTFAPLKTVDTDGQNKHLFL